MKIFWKFYKLGPHNYFRINPKKYAYVITDKEENERKIISSASGEKLIIKYPITLNIRKLVFLEKERTDLFRKFSNNKVILEKYHY